MKREMNILDLYNLWNKDSEAAVDIIVSGNLNLQVDGSILEKTDEPFRDFAYQLFSRYKGDPLPIIDEGLPVLIDTRSSLHILCEYLRSEGCPDELFHIAYLSDLLPVEIVELFRHGVLFDMLLANKDVPDEVLLKCAIPIIGDDNYRMAVTRANINNFSLFNKCPEIFSVHYLVQSDELSEDSFNKLTEFFLNCDGKHWSSDLAFWSSAIHSKYADVEFVMKYGKKLVEIPHRPDEQFSIKFSKEFELIRAHPGLFNIKTLLSRFSYDESELNEFESILKEVEGAFDSGPSGYSSLDYYLDVLLHQDFSIKYFDEKVLPIECELSEESDLGLDAFMETAFFRNRKLNDYTKEHLKGIIIFAKLF